MTEKRYYWLKMPNDFFDDIFIKKLRKISGGDTYIIIYLEMLLMTLETEGRIYYEGVEEDIPKEIALIINEKEDDVRITINYLLKVGLLIQINENEMHLSRMQEYIGSETENARRIRKHRLKKKMLHCNNDEIIRNQMEINCNNIIEKDKDEDLKKIKITNKDEEVSKLTEIIRNDFNRNLSTEELLIIERMANKFGGQRMLYAVNEALVYDRLDLRYVSAILNRWDESGLTTEQIERGER